MSNPQVNNSHICIYIYMPLYLAVCASVQNNNNNQMVERSTIKVKSTCGLQHIFKGISTVHATKIFTQTRKQQQSALAGKSDDLKLIGGKNCIFHLEISHMQRCLPTDVPKYECVCMCNHMWHDNKDLYVCITSEQLC